MPESPSEFDKPTLVVPAFCIGTPDQVRPGLPAIAARWAEHYRETRQFPTPDVVPLGRETLVFTNSTADLSGQPGVRIYLVSELLDLIQRALDWTEPELVRGKFEDTLRQTCWGTLVLAATHRRPDTLVSLQNRVDRLLGCWTTLAQIRYVDFDSTPVRFSDLIQNRFDGLIAMWLAQPTGDVRTDLHAALSALKAADAEIRVERALKRLAQLAATSKRVRNKDKLTDPDFLRSELAKIKADEREAIEVGSSEALTFLIGTDRMLSQR